MTTKTEEQLVQALRRTERNLELAIRGRPVRDMEENIAENTRALDAHEAAKSEGAQQTEAQARDAECAPDVYVVKDERGDPIYCASYALACHEHINDAINEHGALEARHWKVQCYRLMELIPCRKCSGLYAAVPAPHDAAIAKQKGESE